MTTTHHEFSFEKLRVWQEARVLVQRVYRTTRTFPSGEAFGLVSQLNRAAVSVACNLAEGSGRLSRKVQAHFSQLAYSSLLEVACLLALCVDNGLLRAAEAAPLRVHIDGLAAGIHALRRSQISSSAQRLNS